MNARVSTRLPLFGICVVASVLAGIMPASAEASNDSRLRTVAALGLVIAPYREPLAQAPALPWREPEEMVPKDKAFEGLFFAMIGVGVFVLLIWLGKVTRTTEKTPRRDLHAAAVKRLNSSDRGVGRGHRPATVSDRSAGQSVGWARSRGARSCPRDRDCTVNNGGQQVAHPTRAGD